MKESKPERIIKEIRESYKNNILLSFQSIIRLTTKEERKIIKDLIKFYDKKEDLRK